MFNKITKYFTNLLTDKTKNYSFIASLDDDMLISESFNLLHFGRETAWICIDQTEKKMSHGECFSGYTTTSHILRQGALLFCYISLKLRMFSCKGIWLLHISAAFIGEEMKFDEVCVLKILSIMLGPLILLCVTENFWKNFDWMQATWN